MKAENLDDSNNRPCEVEDYILIIIIKVFESFFIGRFNFLTCFPI